MNSYQIKISPDSRHTNPLITVYDITHNGKPSGYQIEHAVSVSLISYKGVAISGFQPVPVTPVDALVAFRRAKATHAETYSQYWADQLMRANLLGLHKLCSKKQLLAAWMSAPEACRAVVEELRGF